MPAWRSTCCSRGFAAALAEGISIFWRGQYAQEAGAAIDAEGVRRMVEWFVIDHRYGAGPQAADRSLYRDRKLQVRRSDCGTSSRPGRTRGWAPFATIKRSDDERLNVYDPLCRD